MTSLSNPNPIPFKHILWRTIKRIATFIRARRHHQLAIAERDYLISRAFHHIQDKTFPRAAEEARSLLITIIPEHNEMSGGIYSFFSIAKTLYSLRARHHYTSIMMTRPNELDETYVRQKHFRNCEDIFRFQQVLRCNQVETLYVLLPEYATIEFSDYITKDKDIYHYLKSRRNFYVNILNQNVELMPPPSAFSRLRAIATGLSQSVAHHAYFRQTLTDTYNLPTLLLPAYTDLSDYMTIPRAEKRKLIIYSPDDSKLKQHILQDLRHKLPEYQLLEIRNMSFDDYMHYATICRYAITFGEGFDGYLAQPSNQGGVAFAAHNSNYFPDHDFSAYKNIFRDEQDMYQRISQTIQELDDSDDQYAMVTAKMRTLYESLYSPDKYRSQVLRLALRQFDLMPFHQPKI